MHVGPSLSTMGRGVHIYLDLLNPSLTVRGCDSDITGWFPVVLAIALCYKIQKKASLVLGSWLFIWLLLFSSARTRGKSARPRKVAPGLMPKNLIAM